jgi:beta-alanine degradation protein BauB
VSTDPRTMNFDIAQYGDELAVAFDNRQVGTKLLFENALVKVWELKLEPGARGPFHCHAIDYFWTCVDGGRGMQRVPDGSAAIHDYEVGQVRFFRFEGDGHMIHDLENVGDSVLRFVTVELKR